MTLKTEFVMLKIPAGRLSTLNFLNLDGKQTNKYKCIHKWTPKKWKIYHTITTRLSLHPQNNLITCNIKNAHLHNFDKF